jgi:undecaprenyl-diphosphatase
MICKFDYFVFFWIHNNLENPVMDHVMSWITYSSNAPFIFIYIFAASIIVGLIYRPKYLRFTLENGINLFKKAFMFMLYGSMMYGVTSGATQILKEITQRPRPYEVHQVRMTKVLKITTVNEENESFPSGHAAGAFLIAVIFIRRFGNRMKALYVWALLVALSRIYLGAHYPSDVIAGGFLGWLMANLIISISIRFWKNQFTGFT